jgi:hemerythrin superfamily protein
MATKKPAGDAIALLKADHRKVEDLFDKFEKARDEKRKQALAREICTELTIHAMIEEEIFYPSCEGKIEGEEVLEEAYVEHDGAKVLISEIMSNLNARFFAAKVTVLSEMIKHHVKEEEKKQGNMFAKARRAGVDTKALGQQMAEEKKTLTAKYKSQGLPKPPMQTFKGTKLA